MPVVLPADLTDKVKAVNVMLQAIGESPVNDIETSESVDVAAAIQTLGEITRTVLSEGWHWNREEGMELAPDGSGVIALPANCLSVAKAYWEPTVPAKVVERGRKLYDRSNHTYIFTQPVSVDMVLLLDWEEMPEYARQYITLRAAQQFQGRLQSSVTVDRITDREVTMTRTVLEQREDEAEGHNQVHGNADVVRRLHGRGVRRRG